jgi:molybdenum cofactor guanylyltransferase
VYHRANSVENKRVFSGIILAGGQSSRLGRDKGLIEWKGRKLVEHAIAVLEPLCSEVIISSNNPEYQQFGRPVVADQSPGYGPMMGLYSALSLSCNENNLVIAVDNLLVTRGFYKYLIAYDLRQYKIAVPFVQNRFYEPLVGFYSTECISVMELMMNKGNYRLPDLIASVTTLKLHVETDFPDYHPDYFRSLNTPEDLAWLNELPAIPE